MCACRANFTTIEAVKAPEAARGRRGLDGRGAVVTRIWGDAPAEPHSLVLRSVLIPKGYITLAKIKQKIRFNITDEMSDSQRELNGLATTLQSLAPGDPERTAIIQRMMELSGSAPASYPAPANAPAPVATPTPAKPTRVNQALPAGQQ